MRNVNKIMVVFILMAGMMMFLSNQVKAEMTYDLNGNQTDVSVWTKSTSLKDGSYKITSSEAGTIAYFDKNGKLLKLENKSTGEIIINNEETTTAKIKVPETTKTPDKVTMPKVKKLKKNTQYSYYKGVKSVKKNGKAKWGKIKYKYGITLSWKKVKNAKGYEIYRYENAKECWTKIKTTKKTSYTLTNMLEGENVKIRVRSYKKTSSGNEYGTYSGILKFKTKQMYTKIYKNGKTKGFYSKWASEDAFVIQNQYRKIAGVQELEWNDALYDVAKVRSEQIVTDFSHDKFVTAYRSVLSQKAKQKGIEFISTGAGMAENIAGDFRTIKEAMKAWKNSKGHYANMIDNSFDIGSIAVYYKNGQMGCRWGAIFMDTSQNGTRHKNSQGFYTVDLSFMY